MLIGFIQFFKKYNGLILGRSHELVKGCLHFVLFPGGTAPVWPLKPPEIQDFTSPGGGGVAP